MTKTKSAAVLPLERTVTTMLETIDPAKARKFLDSSEGNRPIAEKHVESLANEISRGNWMAWASPIQINASGHLINGHHRMLAVIRADKAIQQAVARNVPDNTIEVIDMGRARTLGDALSMPTEHYVANGRAIAAIVTSLQTILVGHPTRVSVATLTQYREVIGAQRLASALRWRERARTGRIPSPSVLAASLLLAHRCEVDTPNEAISAQFCEDVSGSVGVAGDPSYALVRWCMSTGRRATVHDIWKRVAGAHVAHLSQKKLTITKCNEDAARKCREHARSTWARAPLGL